MLTVTINGGIGDILHSKPLLDQVDGQYDLCLSELAVTHYRSKEHIEFSRTLAERVFRRRVGPPPSGLFQGYTPQDIVATLHVRPVMPDFRDVLTRTIPNTVSVLTKVRGWHRRDYEAVRPRFLELIREVSKSYDIAIVGERKVTYFREYQMHTDNMVYSIYDDLVSVLDSRNVLDMTQETIPSCPDFDLFARDCRLIQSTENTIVLGTGGNATMGMSFGNFCPIMAHATEMGTFLMAMPPSERVPVCRSMEEFLERHYAFLARGR